MKTHPKNTSIPLYYILLLVILLVCLMDIFTTSDHEMADEFINNCKNHISSELRQHGERVAVCIFNDEEMFHINNPLKQ